MGPGNTSTSGSGSGFRAGGTIKLGFERQLYSVKEDVGEVELCIVIISGELTDDLILDFSTYSNTASCKHSGANLSMPT